MITRRDDAAIPRPPKPRPADVRRQLVAAARDLERRQRDLDSAAERLRRERDEAIRSAAAGGLPLADIGAIVGLTQARVSQIIKGRR
jgi:hypothetical protein